MTRSRLNRDRDTRLLQRILVGECGSKLRSRSVHRGGLACGDARQYYTTAVCLSIVTGGIERARIPSET
ncbi:hypothetical protein ACS0PU_002795 [Formica fusca]